MKKMIVLGIVVMVISLGFTACGSKGGDLQIINDTTIVRNFKIYFNGEQMMVNNGQYQIMPSQKVNAHSDDDTTYAVFISTGYIGDGTKVSWTGDLKGGDTVQLKISELGD